MTQSNQNNLKNFKKIILGTFSILASLILINCKNPCEKLSKDVCDCEETQTEQQGCYQRIEQLVANQDKATEDEKDMCTIIRESKSCTCEAVENEDWLSCGLSIESAN